ncbi:daunorubicin resistance protein DrrA family ABC transporter ATP-binding protein [Ktedonobacter sp. SOSP1-52]|uniref:ATP-binding cassette domain-containing protein n=1 Tax=Ktedonobacter sp. SOSP1-52 TaxID=2778366 RepID=UPI001916C561|nr:ATP-binding cassette domain-containing protein [Ktedonobacter sp. SOSP1-52]GHO65444.1 daunorubicin resistance protein DrrA family ABC transporter ATP-binding protein [Ktedonobacter sp. SOSP1-52]
MLAEQHVANIQQMQELPVPDTARTVIDVRNLSKVYKGGVEAVKGISFRVQSGEFFGFLGPNGAGKSTTIKILITLLARTSGVATILGHDVGKESNKVRGLIGYAAQEASPDDELTAKQNLTILGKLYHLDRLTVKRRTDELLELMDLQDVAHRRVGTFSGGMRKRLDLAMALIHRPHILFLDEPTTGLDPQNRASLWKYLEQLNKQEKLTIFLTTHYMEEADRLCDRLAIIDHGQIIAEDAPAAMKAKLGGDLITLSFRAGEHSAEQQAQQAQAVLARCPFVQEATINAEKNLVVIVKNGRESVLDVIRVLEGAHIPVAGLSLANPSLDDVFLKYTGTRIRQEDPVAYTPPRGPWAPRRR